MKTYFSRVLVTLLTLSVGIVVSVWWSARARPTLPPPANLTRPISEDRDDAIEIVFRELMSRYEWDSELVFLMYRYERHPTYFLSYAQSDPTEQFMARFSGPNASVKKLSEAVRNENRVLDRQSGRVGIRLDAAFYYPINDDEVRIGVTWGFSQRLGKDSKWAIWSSEYDLQKVNGKWVIKSYKKLPQIPPRAG
jgi:hypothetical protein